MALPHAHASRPQPFDPELRTHDPADDRCRTATPASDDDGAPHSMGAAYILTLQPTFTQGLILGQLSILCLLVVVLKYLFFDPATAQPYKATSYQPRVVREDEEQLDRAEFAEKAGSEGGSGQADGVESAGWLNVLLHHVRAKMYHSEDIRPTSFQVLDSYRAKLRDDLQGADGDEIVRRRVEEFANKMRPTGFLVCL